MPSVRVVRVLSEDPWVAEPVEEIPTGGTAEAFEVFDEVVRRYEAEGWDCEEYGSASIMLCVRGREKRMIGVWLDQSPEEELRGWW